MPSAVYLLLIAVAAGALFLALAPLIEAWWRSRGKRLVTCPETEEPVALEVDPMDAAFQAFLNEGMSCALCGKELPVIFSVSGQHKPALLNSDRITFEWTDLHVEDLPEILATYQPVCWDCHIVETLYRMHPELITERAPHKPF
jgi:hypothetical protein